MLLSYNFLSSLFLRTFPEKVSDPSAVYNRQSICLQLTEHCAQPTEYMFATDRSVMHCAQPTEYSVQPTDTTDTVKCTTDRVVPTTDIVMR